MKAIASLVYEQYQYTVDDNEIIVLIYQNNLIKVTETLEQYEGGGYHNQIDNP